MSFGEDHLIKPAVTVEQLRWSRHGCGREEDNMMSFLLQTCVTWQQ
jgi:hypothetical protein